MGSVTRAFAGYCATLRGEDLPVPVLDKVELCLLDMLAGALTARDFPWTRPAVESVRGRSGAGEATVVGTSIRAPAADAAFANAVMAHGTLQEDMHPGAASHIGVVVFPAALALAEWRHASGADLAAAVVAGYEVMGRLGRAIVDARFARLFRPTGTIGPMGVAAAAARLFQLGDERTVHALGLGGNFGGGLNQWAWTGAGEVYVHAGMAARSGIMAAVLAGLGATASEDIIEGEAGMLAAFGGVERASVLTEGLGRGFEILSVFHKPAPACNFVQTPCQAALDIVTASGLKARAIESVRVHTFPSAIAYPGCDWAGPFGSVLQAKMSIQFSVASVLVHGRLGGENFLSFDDPEVARVAARTELVADAAITAGFPARQGAEVEVRLVGGETRRARLDDVRPHGPDDVRARFRAAASAVFGAGRAEEIETAVAGLPSARDVAPLARLLALPAA